MKCFSIDYIVKFDNYSWIMFLRTNICILLNVDKNLSDNYFHYSFHTPNKRISVKFSDFKYVKHLKKLHRLLF